MERKVDHNATLTGANLIYFANRAFFRYLRRSRQTAVDPNSLNDKIWQISS
ncbi:MAG: hypothetical protein Q4P24_17370 [Rhodobacterales bacterium]|nr:hypothetical protein [Rhodobacterales bacterium]